MTSGLSKQQLLMVVLVLSACKLSVRHVDVRFRHCKCRCSPRANGSPLQLILVFQENIGGVENSGVGGGSFSIRRVPYGLLCRVAYRRSFDC